MTKVNWKPVSKVLFILGLFASTSLSAGYRTTFRPCPDKPVAVIRCAEGSGDCEASDQLFCDEIIIQGVE